MPFRSFIPALFLVATALRGYAERANSGSALAEGWRPDPNFKPKTADGVEVELTEQDRWREWKSWQSVNMSIRFSAAPSKAEAPCNILQFDNVGINGTNDGLYPKEG